MLGNFLEVRSNAYVQERINQDYKEISSWYTSLKRRSCARHRKKFELRRLSVALKKLHSAEQYLIAYRYFDNKTYPDIAKLSYMYITTVRRKLDNIILEVGRKVYGMEQEFCDAIHGRVIIGN